MTTRVETPAVERATKNGLSGLSGATLLAMLTATAANLGLYYAAGILFPEVSAWPGAGAGQIAGANVVYLLIGAIAFLVIARISSRPARHFRVLATLGLLLSLGLPISAGFGYGPPNTPLAGVATVVTLCLMHVVSYAISVPLFIRMALD